MDGKGGCLDITNILPFFNCSDYEDSFLGYIQKRK